MRDDANAVARLEDRIGRRHEIDVAAAEPRDRGVEVSVDLELADRLADHVLVRYKDATVRDLPRGFREVLGALISEEDARPLERLLGPDRDDLVPRRENRQRHDDRDRVSPLDAAQGEPRLAKVLERLPGRSPGERGIGDSERSTENGARARLLQTLRFFLREVDPEDLREEEKPEDYAEYAERISQTVCDDGAVEVELYGRGTAPPSYCRSSRRSRPRPACS